MPSPVHLPRTLPVQLTTALVGLVAVWSASFFIIQSPLFDQHPQLLSLAVLFDLTVTSGIVVWFALVRPGRLTWKAIVPVLALNLLLARALLPDEGLGGLTTALLVVGIGIEVSISLLALSKLAAIRKTFKAHRAEGEDFYTAVHAGLAPVLPGEVLPRLVALDLSFMRYAAAGWLLKEPLPEGEPFTVHRECNWPAISAAMVGLIMAEAVGGHLLLSLWSTPVAIVHTVLSLYGAIWVLGDMHAIRLRPMVVSKAGLHLSIGLRWRGFIPRTHIQSITRVIDAPKGDDVLDTTLMGTSKLLVDLSEPTTLQGILGPHRPIQRLVINVDDPTGLINALTR